MHNVSSLIPLTFVSAMEVTRAQVWNAMKSTDAKSQTEAVAIEMQYVQRLDLVQTTAVVISVSKAMEFSAKSSILVLLPVVGDVMLMPTACLLGLVGAPASVERGTLAQGSLARNSTFVSLAMEDVLHSRDVPALEPVPETVDVMLDM